MIGKYLKRINIDSLINPAFAVPSGAANSPILKSYRGLLCLGKNDFDAIENFRSNAFFMRALGLASEPSSPTLRQRLDTHAASWFDLAARLMHKVLASTVNGKPIDFGALACGYTPVDLDTFAMDNSSTQKELVGQKLRQSDGQTQHHSPIRGWHNGCPCLLHLVSRSLHELTQKLLQHGKQIDTVADDFHGHLPGPDEAIALGTIATELAAKAVLASERQRAAS